ncbi:hypothetical protein VKT23_008823 [Stygiomarasmius scandens]|uniref:F-box domain-containing protein n=1 Tax=Marasmiellus scandens TaxID=2682957 RepID=A0ABR1JGS4_9AGAR
MELPTDNRPSSSIPLPVTADNNSDRFRSGQYPSSLEITHKGFCDETPIRKVPVEIWVEIFSESCGLWVGYGSVSVPTLAFSQTCSFWRAITLSTPKLWSKLNLHLGIDKRGLQDLFSLYLDRSYPSHLVLEVRAAGTPTARGLAIFWMLMDASYRWREAKLDFAWASGPNGSISSQLEAYLRSHPVQFDNLETLELLRDLKPYPAYHRFLPTTLKGSTALRLVKMEGFLKEYAQAFAHLNEIHLDLNDIQDLADCFTVCGQLRRARLAPRACNFDPILSNDSKIIHHQLSSLECDFTYPEDLNAVLSSLVLPALVTLKVSLELPSLEVSEYFINLSRTLESIKSMIVESSCTLRELELWEGLIPSSRSPPDQPLMELLNLTPMLTRLTLCAQRYSVLSDKLFRSLTLSSSLTTALLPLLEVFHIYIIDDPDFYHSEDGSPLSNEPLPDPEVVAMMVSSRRSEVSRTRLKSFKFDVTLDPRTVPSADAWIKSFTDRALPRLRELEVGGLELVVQLEMEKLF